jgi:capsid protein
MATVMGIIFKQNSAARHVQALPYLTNSQGEQQRAITFENGAVKYIGTDEDVAQVQAHQPMQQTPEFIRTMYRMLGQPFDMPLEVIAKDMSTCTFASARIGLLPFYRSCRIKASRFGTRWSRTIRWWLSRERMRGPNDPKRWTNAFPANYWNHFLLPNAWEYTDPISEAQSDQLQIDMGTKSHLMVIAERGRDAEKIVREREEWAKKTANLPETRSTLTRDPTPEPEEAPPEPNAVQKDMVRALMAHKPTCEAVYNVADIPALLTDAGVKLDPTVDSAGGEGLPVLPAANEEPNE